MEEAPMPDQRPGQRKGKQKGRPERPDAPYRKRMVGWSNARYAIEEWGDMLELYDMWEHAYTTWMTEAQFMDWAAQKKARQKLSSGHLPLHWEDHQSLHPASFQRLHRGQLPILPYWSGG